MDCGTHTVGSWKTRTVSEARIRRTGSKPGALTSAGIQKRPLPSSLERVLITPGVLSSRLAVTVIALQPVMHLDKGGPRLNSQRGVRRMGKRTRERKAGGTRADIRKVQPAGAQLQLEHPDNVAADDDMHLSDLLEPPEYNRGEFEMVGQDRLDSPLVSQTRSMRRPSCLLRICMNRVADETPVDHAAS
jgi:hypothetical protein